MHQETARSEWAEADVQEESQIQEEKGQRSEEIHDATHHKDTANRILVCQRLHLTPYLQNLSAQVSPVALGTPSAIWQKIMGSWCSRRASETSTTWSSHTPDDEGAFNPQPATPAYVGNQAVRLTSRGLRPIPRTRSEELVALSAKFPDIEE